MTVHRLSQRFRMILLIAIATLFVGAGPAQASVCTLADHIRSANTNTAVGFCPAGTSHDVITISEDITLTEPLPPITGAITIEGGGHTISGDHRYRIFDVQGGKLRINNLKLANGSSLGEAGGAIRIGGASEVSITQTLFILNTATWGGGIATTSEQARLVISDSVFRHNVVQERGGAIQIYGGDVQITGSKFQWNRAEVSGGAIQTRGGRTNIENSTMSENSAGAGGGIHARGGAATLTHLTLFKNEASSRSGAEGIHSEAGALNLRNSVIFGGEPNRADCAGHLNQNRSNLIEDRTCNAKFGGNPLIDISGSSRGIHRHHDGSAALDAADAEFCTETDQVGTARPQGGGCDIGAIESTSAIARPPAGPVCTLADNIKAANTNRAVGFCPAGTSHDVITIAEDIKLYAPLPPITGTITIEGGGHTISGNKKFRIFDVQGGHLMIKNLTLENGKATRGSGGFPYMINNERVIMDAGGALRLDGGAEVHIENTTLSANSADVGGAIALLSGKLSVNHSSFVRNKSSEHDGGAIFLRQGAVTITNSSFLKNATSLYGGAIGAQSGSISIANSSFEDNMGSAGGGVLYTGRGDATLTHVTMLNNGTLNSGDAIFKAGGRISLRNSMVAGGGNAEDCVGGLNQNSGNWSEDGTCAFKAGENPLLGKLSGSPAYRALLDGSPALNAADPTFCLPTDQLGTARPQGGACDIGAIESTTAIAAPVEIPALCTLSDQLVAANTDAPFGSCPAGNGADVIFLVRDITLTERLPAITSEITIRGNGYTISGDGKFRIFDVDRGDLTLHDLTLTKGLAPSTSSGGAMLVENGGKASIHNTVFVRNYADYGGAIGTSYPNRGVTINNSEFMHNQAQYSGGAIDKRSGTITITNSSFVKNVANNGGAIDTSSSGRLDVTNSSFIGNSSSGRGGAIYAGAITTLTHVTMLNNSTGIWIYDEDRTLNLRNSLIASDRTGADCWGRLTQNSGNLIEDGSCAPAISGDPLLDDPGGSPAIVTLQEGSPAIDAADPRFCPATDQVGAPRPQGAGCDIGAIEMPALTSGAPSVSAENPPATDCKVTTTHALNFRDAPNGARIGLVPRGLTLVATARTAGWMNVTYSGRAGWISADYVVMDGVCG